MKQRLALHQSLRELPALSKCAATSLRIRSMLPTPAAASCSGNVGCCPRGLRRWGVEDPEWVSKDAATLLYRNLAASSSLITTLVALSF